MNGGMFPALNTEKPSKIGIASKNWDDKGRLLHIAVGVPELNLMSLQIKSQ